MKDALPALPYASAEAWEDCSGWSKRNVEIVARLGEAGPTQPAGLAQVEAAKADGRWVAA